MTVAWQRHAYSWWPKAYCAAAYLHKLMNTCGDTKAKLMLMSLTTKGSTASSCCSSTIAGLLLAHQNMTQLLLSWCCCVVPAEPDRPRRNSSNASSWGNMPDKKQLPNWKIEQQKKMMMTEEKASFTEEIPVKPSSRKLKKISCCWSYVLKLWKTLQQRYCCSEDWDLQKQDS